MVIFTGSGKSDFGRLLWLEEVTCALERILGVTREALLQNIPAHDPLDDEVRHAAVMALWKRKRGGPS
jgi:hypothetical protein